ncbi:putative membrane protein YeaQ/YmgE (transglycosylase-associated protein family) [Curtobacterium flaccumfaciens]|uniref:Membrane protein YeaQ/YmgE (Transglycosylase-associated protein family) n=1 Tax=Curtobacterium salicis TaxID=1779862 RepID=A0ABX0T7L3_9MICO|nr:FtsX-like permease family protein [Curtobacterium sp. WW7]NII41471.1 putative membrane protein YeaQ/YmgE (transglycosylase-associated protein family) [Curtobacterium sp. WW7]
MSERLRRDTHRPTIRTRTPFAVRPALLLARRLAFARPGRAVLVAALIGLPIAGLAAGGVLIASSTQSTEDRLAVELGQSAAMLEANGPDIAGMRQDPVDRYTSTIDEKSPLQRYYDRPATSDADASAFPTPDLLGSVPDGAASIPVRQGTAVVSGPRVPVTVNAVEGQTWAGALQGHWERIDGGVPRSGNEVLVTPATLDRLHIAIGQTLELNDPVQRQVTVVGTLRDLGQPTSSLGVFGEWGALGLEDDTTAQVFLPDRSVTWPEIRRYNDHGILVESRAVVLDPPFPSASTRGSGSLISYGYVGLAGVFALFEVGLLAAAAFLVSSRADTRTHAVLASVGGDRRFLFAVVSSSGLVLGAVGAIVGTALGIVGGVVAFHLLDSGDRAQYPGVHLPWLVLLVVLVLGVLAGWAASLVAARSASRVDVDSALRGATRPAPVSRRRWAAAAGPVLAAVGIVMTLACGIGVLALNARPVQEDHLALVVGAGVALGPCLAQLGVVLAARRLLGAVARIGERFGLPARIAVRDAVRNPVRTVPVLASVMSVVFVATVVLSFTASQTTQSNEQYEFRTATGVGTTAVTDVDGAPDAELTARAVRVVRQVVPEAHVRVLGASVENRSDDSPVTLPVDVDRPDCASSGSGACSAWLVAPDSTSPHVLTGSADDLGMLLGHRPSRAARAALDRGDAVAVRPEFVHDGVVRFDTRKASQFVMFGQQPTGEPLHTSTVPAVVEHTDQPLQIAVFLTPQGAARHGLETAQNYLVGSFPDGMSTERSDTLAATWQASAGPQADSWYPSFTIEAGPQDPFRPIALVVVLLAGIVTLGATTVAIGLARADGRRDDEVLDAIGASPGIRRRVSTWQAAVLTLVGSLVGVVLGVLPLRALTLRFTPTPLGVSHLPFAPDPTTLVVLALGLPVLVTAGVWTVAGRRRRVAVRRTV